MKQLILFAVAWVIQHSTNSTLSIFYLGGKGGGVNLDEMGLSLKQTLFPGKEGGHYLFVCL
jgi:hypothetical protein